MSIKGTPSEEFIKQAIWDDMWLNVTVTIEDDLVEIFPDSSDELGDYWGVVADSNDYDEKLCAMEDYWTAQLPSINATLK